MARSIFFWGKFLNLLSARFISLSGSRSCSSLQPSWFFLIYVTKEEILYRFPSQTKSLHHQFTYWSNFVISHNTWRRYMSRHNSLSHIKPIVAFLSRWLSLTLIFRRRFPKISPFTTYSVSQIKVLDLPTSYMEFTRHWYKLCVSCASLMALSMY